MTSQFTKLLELLAYMCDAEVRRFSAKSDHCIQIMWKFQEKDEAQVKTASAFFAFLKNEKVLKKNDNNSSQTQENPAPCQPEQAKTDVSALHTPAASEPEQVRSQVKQLDAAPCAIKQAMFEDNALHTPVSCKRKRKQASTVYLQEMDNTSSDSHNFLDDNSSSEWDPNEFDTEESDEESGSISSKEIKNSYLCPDSRSCSPIIPKYPMLMQSSSLKESVMSQLSSPKESVMSQLSPPKESVMSQLSPPKESVMSQLSPPKESVMSQLSSPKESVMSQLSSPKESVMSQLSSPKEVLVGRHKNIKKRVWDKQHMCVYCSKLFSKLSKHLERRHSNELEVAKAFSLQKNSRERKAALKQLMNRGDFMHNLNVTRTGKGELIAARRPTEQESCKEFTTCDGCFGLYKKHDLWRHKRKCVERKCISGHKRHRNIDPLHGSYTNQQAQNSLFTTNIINKLAPDLVNLEVKQDAIICQMGENLFRKSVKQPHQHQYIRQKMRELGKLLIEIKKLEGTSCSIKDCIDPVQFNNVVAAVKNLSGFDVENSVYGVPSLALKLGYSLQMCANIVRSNALKMGRDEDMKKAEAFLDLYKSDWAHEISSVALNTLHGHKFNKAKRIPLAEDLKTLYEYLNDKVGKAKEELRNHPSPENWRDLAEGTLAQVSLFNRRRGGEMQRMELRQYQDGLASGKGNQEVLESLTPFERKLAERLHRVEIRGKRGRRVPVLLTHSYKESLDLLVDFREVSGIPEDNKFVFALCEGTLRTSDVLRKCAQLCGAARPDLLTTTSLRKHIGTISQLLNLKDNELDALASFMGHDIRVHRNFYRLPEDTYQIAKVSKILLQLEQGKINSCSGKSLDDITLNEDEEVEFEQSDDDDDNEVPESGEVHVSDHQTMNSSSLNQIEMKNMKKVSQVVKRSWSEEEENAVQRCLGKYFGIPQLPGKSECMETLRKEPALHNRTWVQIKSFIKNRKVSLQRRRL